MSRGSGPAKLGEVLGKQGAEASESGRKLGVKDLAMLMGDITPKVEFTIAGKMRLLNMLKQRFGDGFRHVKEVNDILADFEDEMKINRVVRKNKHEQKPKEA